MKNTFLVFCMMVTLSLFGVQQASASWYFDIEETSLNVYDFLLITDETLAFDGGTGSFLYDNPEILDWTYTFSFPSPLTETFGPPNEFVSGDIDNFTGVSFGAPATVLDDIVLATFTFTGTGDANFRFDMDDQNMVFEVNGMFYSAIDNPEVFGAPVPVPAGIWLLGSGLLGLWGMRRKRS